MPSTGYVVRHMCLGPGAGLSVSVGVLVLHMG